MDSSRSWVTMAKRFGKCKLGERAGSCHCQGPSVCMHTPHPTDEQPRENKKFMLFLLARVLPALRS